MTTTFRPTALAAGTAFATLMSALVVLSTQDTATPTVHELPRVVITGQVVRDEAPRIVQLPRVVITGQRTPADTAMAQAGRASADGV